MKKKNAKENSENQVRKTPESRTARGELYRFGEVAVQVEGVDVNIWQCSVEGTTIGFVTYTPEYKFRTESKGRDYGFQGFHSDTIEDAQLFPATDVNRYSSLRNAARAVVACHYSGRQYTYIHDNIAILDGKVVPESVFKGRKIIKPTLESRSANALNRCGRLCTKGEDRTLPYAYPFPAAGF